MSAQRIARRDWLKICGGGIAAGLSWNPLFAQSAKPAQHRSDLTISEMIVTPIALPDPPLLAASGCHGPYFLRNIVQLKTTDGIVGISETKGDLLLTEELEKLRGFIVGKSVLDWQILSARATSNAGIAAIEMACLDAMGQAFGLRVCDLLGGPAREEVEFASYLFYRYAADHRVILDDERIVDHRGRGAKALDQWGEVRTPESMADMAWKFHQKWGFQVHKLKAGVLDPETELETFIAINDKFGGKHPLRIDPNGRWSIETAVRIGHQMRERELPLEYYEDPVAGQEAMAVVRKETGWTMSTNMCVTRFEHLVDAVRNEPIDVVLADCYSFGGIPACQNLGTLAETLGWGVGQHSNSHTGISMAAMIHTGAVVPEMTFASDTHYVWLPDEFDIIQGPKLPIENGKMQIPSGPGLGVKIDHDKLARAHEAYQKCGMRERDDASLMRRLVPGWARENPL